MDLPKAIELSCTYHKSCLPFLWPPKETCRHTVPTCAQLLLDSAPAFLSPSLMFAIGMFPIWPLGPGCLRTSDNGTGHNFRAPPHPQHRRKDRRHEDGLREEVPQQRTPHTHTRTAISPSRVCHRGVQALAAFRHVLRPRQPGAPNPIASRKEGCADRGFGCPGEALTQTKPNPPSRDQGLTWRLGHRVEFFFRVLHPHLISPQKSEHLEYRHMGRKNFLFSLPEPLAGQKKKSAPSAPYFPSAVPK